jgi:hypothetical protein
MKYDAASGKVKDKLPKKLGDAVDLLFEVQAARRRAAKVVEGLKSSESALARALLDKFKKDELNGAKGSRGQCELKPKDVPTPKDWKKIWTYIRKNQAEDLLQKRLNTEAVQLRWADGEAIPGIEKFHVIKVSITARKGGKK